MKYSANTSFRLGSLFIVTGTVLFLLGLEFGGVQKPWSSPIVVCFILFGLLVMIAFAFVEWKQAKYPIMPIRLFQHTTNIASYIVSNPFSFIAYSRELTRQFVNRSAVFFTDSFSSVDATLSLSISNLSADPQLS